MTTGVDLCVPYVVFDDDNWMDVFESTDELNKHIEWPFIDEITAVYDGRARLIRVSVESERVVLELFDSTPRLADLQIAAELFFESWIDDPPPPRLDQPDAYVAALLEHYRRGRRRRRKRKSPT